MSPLTITFSPLPLGPVIFLGDPLPQNNFHPPEIINDRSPTADAVCDGTMQCITNRH